jgi:hypothetical protein
MKKIIEEEELLECGHLDGDDLVLYINSLSEEEQITYLYNSSYDIKYIKYPSEKVQLIAVTINPLNIQIIKTPTEAVKLKAVSLNCYAIFYINNPSDAIQMEAVKSDHIDDLFVNKWITSPKALALYNKLKTAKNIIG